MHARRLALALAPALALGAAAALGADGAAGVAGDARGGGDPGGIVDSGHVLRIVGTLVLVLGLIVGLAWLVRRLGPMGGGSGNLRVLAAVSVGQRERIVLVSVADRQLLVGVAPGSVRLLERFDEPVVEPPERPAGDDFAARLRAALARQGRAA